MNTSSVAINTVDEIRALDTANRKGFRFLLENLSRKKFFIHGRGRGAV